MEEEEKYKKAKERVEEIKGFYVHAIVYVVVNVFLAVINLVTNPGYLWFLWPLGGWGFGLLMHALSVFVFNKSTSWEQKKIKEIMEKMDK
jgi:hypothetical protein